MDCAGNKVKLAGEVVQSFMSVSKTLVKFTQQNASSLGLSVLQMGILNTIYAAPNITLKEITEKLQLPKSTVSSNVDDLFEAKLIERKTGEDDRREINLKLTAAGETLAKQSCQNASSYKAMAAALNDFSEEEIQQLLRLHKALLSNLGKSL